MASERGSTATEAHPAPSTATVPQPSQASFGPVTDLTRQKSLKRPRETTPTPQDPLASGGDISPSKIARLVGFARQSHPPLADEAVRDERGDREEEAAEQELHHNQHQHQYQHQHQHQHQHPGLEHGEAHASTQRALDDLMAGVPADMSRAHDAPSDTGQSEVEAAAAAAARALHSVNIPSGHVAADDNLHDVSPQSGTSGASLEDGDGHVVDSPTAMEVDPRSDEHPYGQQPEAQMDDKVATSLSYPGAVPASTPAHRVMSMPMPTPQTPTSPNSSNKKHKCPYCETEFTRHHNLKSHLLTHSQEKPYICQSCQARFRRLHDLKRHSKLHTGEKPHVCPSCDRKFARGDALARHSKGAGGCAGRRQTMASFSLRDGYDGGSADNSAMSGDLYDGGDLSDEERRRLSMPSIKTQHVTGQPGTEGYIAAAHSNTYPPAGPRPGAAGGLYPPNVDRGSSSTNTSPSVPNNGHTPHTSISSVPLSAGSSSLFSQGGMTESPKPLSPGAVPAAAAAGQPRQATANEQHHHQQPQQQPPQQPGTAATPAGLALPSHGMSQAAKQAWLSQYPPPADRDASQGLNHAGGAAAISTAGQPQLVRVRGGAASGAGPGAGAGGPTEPQGGSEGSSDGVTADPNLLAYLQHQEETIKRLATQVEANTRDNAQFKAQIQERLTTHEQQIQERLTTHEQRLATLVAEIKTDIMNAVRTDVVAEIKAQITSAVKTDFLAEAVKEKMPEIMAEVRAEVRVEAKAQLKTVWQEIVEWRQRTLEQEQQQQQQQQLADEPAQPQQQLVDEPAQPQPQPGPQQQAHEGEAAPVGLAAALEHPTIPALEQGDI